MAPSLTDPKRLPKGTFPPLLTLAEAAPLAVKLYEHGGGEATYDLFSQITENPIHGSTSIKNLPSLRMCGLAVEQNRTVSLTDLGLAIAAPASAESAASALKAALLKIDIFNRIYERHRGKLLPADEFLRNIIQSDFRIPREIADRWVRSFKDSARASGLLLERPDGKTQVRDAASRELSKAQGPAETAATAPDIRLPEASRGDLVDVTVPTSASGQSSRFEVSGGRYASFYVPDRITKRDAEKLKGVLAGLSAMIDSLVLDENGSS